MKAFSNDPAVKQKYLDRLKAHYDADEIVKGHYWEKGKGCAVGCTIHSGNHSEYETGELQIPQILSRLEDRIFENIPNHLAKEWPIKFIEAIPVGADLSKVWPKFAIFLLTDTTQCDSRHNKCVVVADCYKREMEGEEIDWYSVRLSAYADAAYAAAYASTAYASTAAAYAAYADAAYAAAYADAAYADAAAAYAAAYAAARERAFIAQSEKLLELLKESEVN